MSNLSIDATNRQNAGRQNNADRHDTGFGQKVWDFLSSVKLTVVLFIALAATSIVGTVIPQNDSPAAYVETYGQARAELLRSLQLTDLFHSAWFVPLLALLILNLLVCSLKRLPASLKAMSPPDYRIDEGFFSRQHEHASFHTTLAPAEVASRLALVIRARFTTKAAPLFMLALIAGLLGVFIGLLVSDDERMVLGVVASLVVGVVGGELLRRMRVPAPRLLAQGEGAADEAVVLYAEKGRVSRLGVYVVHASIILVMAGAMIGLAWGVRGAVRIPEGNTVDSFFLRNPERKVSLPFSIRLDDFAVSFYDAKGNMPKEYKSVLSVIDGGKVVATRPVVVNSPLIYGGYHFYQADYGEVALSGVTLKVRSRSGGAATVLKMPGLNRGVALPGGGFVGITEYEKDLANLGPAFRLREEFPGGKIADFWVLERQPEFDSERGGENIYATDKVERRYFTGLEVSRDLGVWVVWGGCTLMVLGFLVAFFMSHRRLWVRAAAAKGGKTLVQMGGRTNKNRPGFETEFAALSETLKGVLK
ncbi:MAG: cytochrome c biogenesis protein ResB [Pseudomonadota bacterium]